MPGKKTPIPKPCIECARRCRYSCSVYSGIDLTKNTEDLQVWLNTCESAGWRLVSYSDTSIRMSSGWKDGLEDAPE